MYSDGFGQCPGMMYKSRACPCRVLTAPLIQALAASGINVSQPHYLCLCTKRVAPKNEDLYLSHSLFF